MSRIKKIATISALVIALAATTLAGCGKKINGAAEAFAVNGESVNVGTANFILRYQQAQTVSMMQMYGLQDTTSIWNQIVSNDEEDTSSASSASSSATSEEITYGEDFQNTVLDQIERMVLYGQHMADYDVSITDEQKAAIDELAKSNYEANKDAYKAMGTSQEDVVKGLTLLSNEYFMRDAMIADVDREVSDEEAAQTSITFARYFTKEKNEETDEMETVSDEKKAEIKEKAEQFLSELQASEDPASASFEDLAKAIDESFSVLSVNYGDDDTYYSDVIKDAVEKMEDGEVYDQVLEIDDYFYVFRLDKHFDEEKTESKKETIILERENARVTELIDGWVAEAELDVKDGWKKLKVNDQNAYQATVDPNAQGASLMDQVTGAIDE